MADPAGRAGDETRFRSIEMLGDLVGRYCWVEHRIFEMTGAWASAPSREWSAPDGRPRHGRAPDGGAPSGSRDSVSPDTVSPDTGSLDAADAERMVWCAAASRRHGALSGRWRERLPLRAGVDRAALMAPPPGQLPMLLEELAAAADLWDGLDGLVRVVLPGLAETYGAHLSNTSAVSEGAVIEVLVEARREGLRDIQGGLALLQRVPRTGKKTGHGAPTWAGDTGRIVERAFDEFSVFPAVRPS